MPSVPYVTYTETSDPVSPQGTGGQVILVVAKSQHTAELTKIFEFNSLQEAQADHATTGIGPDHANNDLLKIITDIFTEAKLRDASDKIGLDKVYAINMGPTPTDFTDWQTAVTLSEKKKDVDIELYRFTGTYTTPYATWITFLSGGLATHLNSLEAKGQPRLAVVSTPSYNETVANLDKITDYTTYPSSNVCHDRIVIVDDQNSVRKLDSIIASKIACTPPWQDPSYLEYRTPDVYESYIEPTMRSDADLETLTSGGFMCSWERIGYPGLGEPVRAVSSAFRKIATMPEANLHIRRNVDYCWKQICAIIMKQLKANDTKSNLQSMQEMAKAFLETQIQEEHLQAYELEVIPDPADVYGVKVIGKLQPMNAIYFINMSSVIQAPA